MYVPEKLKLNKFRLVRIPSNASYFARYGQQNPDAGQYTGEDTLPVGQTKVDQLAEAAEFYERYAAEADDR